MNLAFDQSVCEGYKSPSQRARVLTERWVAECAFCPSCGNPQVKKFDNNRPVADFSCHSCLEEFELKSKKQTIGNRIVDGAYRTMLMRLNGNANPNLSLLSYDPANLSVTDFLVIPKHFFVPGIIERRKPLAATARRAGWIGCNILLDRIPDTGKIFLVEHRKIRSRKDVLREWKKTLFLRDQPEISAKGWVLDVMRCIDRLRKKEFALEEVYAFESELRLLYPGNRHIREKIRQQLQILRDKGYLQFVSRGQYRLA